MKKSERLKMLQTKLPSWGQIAKELVEEEECMGVVWDPEEPLPETLQVRTNSGGPFLCPGGKDAVFNGKAQMVAALYEAVRRYNAWKRLGELAVIATRTQGMHGISSGSLVEMRDILLKGEPNG